MKLRPIEVVRGSWGLLLLVAPNTALGHVNHVPVDRASTIVARILGARQLTQAALSGVDPSPDVLALGVWVDCAHAGTAVGLAAVDRARARAGLTDAAVAAAWAAFGHHDLVTSRRACSDRDRLRDRAARRVLQFVPGGHALMDLADQTEPTP